MEEKTNKELEKVLSAAVMEPLKPDTLVKDSYHLERFGEYCYMSKPRKKSNDYYMNDIYYYSALLYSILTGKCFVKDFNNRKAEEVKKSVDNEETAAWLNEVFVHNLGEEIEPTSMITIKEIVLKLLSLV